ncbi:MAG: hypothetical protein AMXMBFR84_35890 [Candidatus Hydrogenedentota bacterium]
MDFTLPFHALRRCYRILLLAINLVMDFHASLLAVFRTGRLSVPVPGLALNTHVWRPKPT